MPSSAIIDLAIGLTLVFGVTAAISSALTELIARLIGLRGAYLLTGLRELVDDSTKFVNLPAAQTDYKNAQTLMADGTPPAPPTTATGALLGGPILGNQGVVGKLHERDLTLAPGNLTGRLPRMAAKLPPGSMWTPPKGMTAVSPRSFTEAVRTWGPRRQLPSYISARSFAEAVIDMVVPDAHGDTTMDVITENIGKLPGSMSSFKTSLQALATNAGDDLGQFAAAVEHWYDDHMDRVSGWYKRHVAKITLAVGAVLVVLFNINTLTIARTLYSQSAVNQAVSAVAAKAVNCPAGQSGPSCLSSLEEQVSAAATAGLPIGWGTARACRVPTAHCNWWDRRGITSPHGNSAAQVLLVLAGFLITIIALVPGAQFWFGLLTKLGTLRSSGPKPAPAGRG
jgi:hypothetical protein